METLRVSGSSRPNSVAGAIAALLRTERALEVQAIGPHAVNQTVKAMAIARGYVRDERLDLICQPQLVKLTIDGEERTAVRFSIRVATPADEAPALPPTTPGEPAEPVEPELGPLGE